MTKIIAITGGKGGTGKSTVATALAHELSEKQKILLVDADVDCPNDHLILNIKREELISVRQRIPRFDAEKCIKCGKCGEACEANALISVKGRVPILMPDECNGCGACKIVCPTGAISWDYKEIGKIYKGNKGNLDILSGELNINQPTSEFIVSKLNEEIISRKEEYQTIIIDTAAGTHCPVITAFENADKIIAITEPTPLGAHDLKIILDVLKTIGKKGSIIINRADIGDENLIKELAKKYDSEIILKIPFSKEIINSYSRGKTFKIAQLVEKITKKNNKKE